VRTSAALFVLLALAGGGGSDASSEAYPAAACPIDDAALCERAAAAADALASGDARRSYHLAFEAGDQLGSLELVRRAGEWWIAILFADTEAGWKPQFASPRTELACGNVRPWGTG
jgi:hypothetical protein